jgi:uncharacterized membrane protein YgcG
MVNITMEELLSIPGISLATDEDRPGGDRGDATAPGADAAEAVVVADAGTSARETRTRKRARKDAGDADAAADADDAPAPAPALERVETREAVLVPARLVGAIVGVGGHGARAISGLTATTLTFERDDGIVNAGSSTREVVIEGVPDAVAAAKEMLLRRVEEELEDERGGNEASREMGPIEPDGLVAAIIGKGGVTSRAIATVSGVDAFRCVDEVDRGVLARFGGSNGAVARCVGVVQRFLEHGADVDGAHAYAATIVAEAEAMRRAAEDARMGMETARKRERGAGEGDGGGGDGGGGGGDGGGGGGGDELDDRWGGWRTVATKHPDGSDMTMYTNVVTGETTYDAPKPRAS